MAARASSVALALVTPLALTELDGYAERATDYVLASKSASTREAYARDYKAFEKWCKRAGRDPLPALPTTIGLFLAAMAAAGQSVATLERRLVGIADKHRSSGFEFPRGHVAVRGVMSGIRRKHGVAQKKKDPILIADLARLVAELGDDLAGLRDRAVLCLGLFGALRRSELVALDVGAVQFVKEGMIIQLKRSKTDQEGQGSAKGVPFASDVSICPVRALRAWLEAAKIEAGPLFRAVTRHGRMSGRRMAPKSIAHIVQRVARAAGLTGNLSSHSLRAGFATSAAAKGSGLDSIMKQTGHKSERVARGYIRHASLFVGNAAVGLG